MNLEKLKKIYSGYGCKKIYVKKLAPNDNSKNQVYLGGNFEILNIFPIDAIVTEESGDWERERFKAKLDFGWLQDDGQLFPAPNAQLILYPKYPEVRFSGFLMGSINPPSELMTQRLEGRLLFFGVSQKGRILGYVVSPDSVTAKGFNELDNLTQEGVFKTLEVGMAHDSKTLLLNELTRINRSNWIESKRLDRYGKVIACNSPNCGGYTLEAELGITPNGYSEPDFHGWEVKQFNVKGFNRLDASIITLMTPEPTGGVYTELGLLEFVVRYGYADMRGRADRRNFGGIHKFESVQSRTQLRLTLIGFDNDKNKIRSTNGMIALMDTNKQIAASWDFSSLLIHWNKKHNLACYVPSMSRKEPSQAYKFGDKVLMCQSTDFILFLKEIYKGNIYYDPGIKIENFSGQQTSKRRSQFRIKSRCLKDLYYQHSIERL